MENTSWKKRFEGIAIVLCSIFLLVLPATTIAAEQNVLGVYGNANEDDTIDMRDLTYVKLIFFGKKPVTELADAKYDGKINPLDFIQIKLIIVGKEKELTIVQYLGYPPDFTEEPVTVPMPIERIVITNNYCAETLCAFGTQDKIIGVPETAKQKGELKIILKDKPLISKGPHGEWNLEKILELKPDIVLAYAYKPYLDYEKKLSAAGIPVVQMDFFRAEKYFREMKNAGWVLDKKERAEELVNFEQQHLNLIKERVEDLKEEQKPRVYFESSKDYQTMGPGTSDHTSLIVCGGINIFADSSTKYPTIDPEAVIVRNPQVILKKMYYTPSGYDVTDTGPMNELRNDIMNRPAWDDIDAVKNGRVYLISPYCKSTHPSIWHSYIAKMLHPKLFEDIDPVKIHREWIETFLGIEYMGVYAYPIPS